MKLLEYPRNAQPLPLAKRDSHYKITNIAAPLPTAMTFRDFEDSELMVVSHPGWRRCDLSIRSNLNIQEYKDFCYEFAKKRGTLRGLNAQQLSQIDTQLSKVALILTGRYNYLLEELKVECAIESASKLGMPIVLTVPCMCNSDRTYSALDLGTLDLANYLNYRIMQGQRIYALPTHPNNGRIIIDFGYTFEESIRFARSQAAQKLVGNLFNHRWEKIYFTGGQIKNCLKSTIAYFSTQPIVRLIDDFCYTSDPDEENKYKPMTLPKDLEDLCDISASGLVNLKLERRFRFALLYALNAFDSVDNRAKEYAHIMYFFREFGLDKDTKLKEDSQLCITRFDYKAYKEEIS